MIACKIQMFFCIRGSIISEFARFIDARSRRSRRKRTLLCILPLFDAALSNSSRRGARSMLANTAAIARQPEASHNAMFTILKIAAVPEM